MAAGASITCSLRYPDGCRVLGFTDDDFVAITEGGLRVPIGWREKKCLPAELRLLHLRLCSRICG